jgi:hypothetical protein
MATSSRRRLSSATFAADTFDIGSDNDVLDHDRRPEWRRCRAGDGGELAKRLLVGTPADGSNS